MYSADDAFETNPIKKISKWMRNAPHWLPAVLLLISSLIMLGIAGFYLVMSTIAVDGQATDVLTLKWETRFLTDCIFIAVVAIISAILWGMKWKPAGFAIAFLAFMQSAFWIFNLLAVMPFMCHGYNCGSTFDIFLDSLVTVFYLIINTLTIWLIWRQFFPDGLSAPQLSVQEHWHAVRAQGSSSKPEAPNPYE
ncbi:MAG: hypothetical protein JEZ00_15970 [Anaerolineaceae bacterium]|nr:hypothetical protein [Anaerolineaceae bacterium]